MHIKYANIYSQGHSHSYLFKSLLLSVTQKCAKEAAVEVIQYCYEEILIELESCRKLQTQMLITYTDTDHRTYTEDMGRCCSGNSEVFCTHLSCHLPNTVNELQEDW